MNGIRREGKKCLLSITKVCYFGQCHFTLSEVPFRLYWSCATNPSPIIICLQNCHSTTSFIVSYYVNRVFFYIVLAQDPIAYRFEPLVNTFYKSMEPLLLPRAPVSSLSPFPTPSIPERFFTEDWASREETFLALMRSSLSLGGTLT
jgi:hypothetical protein